MDTQSWPIVRREVEFSAIRSSAFNGAHSDIRHPELLWAVVSAAGLTA